VKNLNLKNKLNITSKIELAKTEERVSKIKAKELFIFTHN